MADEEQGYLKAITPGVMAHLERSNFFNELDQLFSPDDRSVTAKKCDGSFSASGEILKRFDLSDELTADVFEVLRSKGGFCDCEVLYNVAPDSRLRSAHWKRQAAPLTPRHPHGTE
jgi:hypothetical protein